MHRFFCSFPNIKSNAKLIIDDKKQVHHLKDVLCLRSGEGIMVCDERGNQYWCIIGEVGHTVSLKVKEKRLGALEAKNKVKITIACAIPKNSKFDDIIDKLTQLGVDRIIPLKTERTIIKIPKNKEKPRLERWRRIAESASRQSQRNTIPVLDGLKGMAEFLKEVEDYDLKLIPTLTGQRKHLKDILARTKAKNILIFIGPEGDFTPAEVKLAKKAGCVPISLGDLVLRVETAAVAVAAFIKLYENH